jgi:hypothetical protein
MIAEFSEHSCDKCRNVLVKPGLAATVVEQRCSSAAALRVTLAVPARHLPGAGREPVPSLSWLTEPGHDRAGWLRPRAGPESDRPGPTFLGGLAQREAANRGPQTAAARQTSVAHQVRFRRHRWAAAPREPARVSYGVGWGSDSLERTIEQEGSSVHWKRQIGGGVQCGGMRYFRHACAGKGWGRAQMTGN